jgi:hypothetical protein
MSDRHVPPIDDLPHHVGPEPEFSESLYFQFGDPSSGNNGFLRLANRPNEDRGEQTVCLFLADGRVAFSFGRAAFADPAVCEAGGMRVVVDDPLVAQRVTFEGETTVLADPWAMTNPKTALAESPRSPCSIELTVRAIAPAQAFSLDEHGDFTANHFDQFVAMRGVVRLGSEELTLRAHGMRDRGWGPRSWQAPSFYRWLFGSCDGFGFAAGVLGRDGSFRTGGFVWEDERMHALDDVVVHTDYDGDAVGSVRLELLAADGSWTVDGRAVNAIPLRHRRPDGEGFTRILESSVLWTADARQMLGIAEYLDQIVDGQPAGIAEYDLVKR